MMIPILYVMVIEYNKINQIKYRFIRSRLIIKTKTIMIYKILLLLVFHLILLLVVAIEYNYQSFAKDWSTRAQNTTAYYGCASYNGAIHCDRMHNKFESYEIPSSSS